MSRPTWARWVTRISLGVGIVALVLTIRDTGLVQIGTCFKRIGWGWVAVVILEIAITTLDATAIRAFLSPDHDKVRLGSALLSQLAGRAVNAVTPSGNLGEAVKVSVLVEHVSQSRAVATILLYNVVSFTVELVTVGIAALLMALFLPMPAALRWVLLGGGAVVFALGLAIYALVRRGVLVSAARLAARIPVPGLASVRGWLWKLERSETRGGDPDGSAGGAGGRAPRGIERSETGGTAGPRIIAVKQVHPIAACRFARDRLDVAIGEARLDDGALRGTAAAGGHTLGWDLRYTGGQPPLLLLPERLYAAALPRAKALVGRPLARFTGTLTIDGVTLVIDDWVGSQNHNWGAKHTDRYAWGQVAGFDEAPDAFLECSTARLQLGPLELPAMSPVLLRLGGETLAWNGLVRAIRAHGRYAPYDWQIETSGPAGNLALRITADPADFVALRYGNPPGGSKICLNSKIARCELALRRGGQRTVLHSSRAAFEILDDTAPPGVEPVV